MHDYQFFGIKTLSKGMPFCNTSLVRGLSAASLDDCLVHLAMHRSKLHKVAQTGAPSMIYDLDSSLEVFKDS